MGVYNKQQFRFAMPVVDPEGVQVVRLNPFLPPFFKKSYENEIIWSH